jgi:fumarylacetoacetase
LSVSPESDFSIANIPFGLFSTPGTAPRCGSRLGDWVIDLHALQKHGFFNGLGFDSSTLCEETMNKFMALTRPAWRATRDKVCDLLREGGDASLKDNALLRSQVVIAIQTVTMHLPAEIGDYTDFYSSREHATNVGTMFRGIDNALQPNWLHLPVGYHGRSSSVVVSGTDVVRPRGQLQANKEDPSQGSTYGPCRLMDFELEMACYVGGPTNTLGRALTMAEAEDRIFGLVVMNDWSARDIQAWEYVPLGPFTAKNFCTSVSAWIVSLDALDPFRCHSSAGPVQNNPVPLPYITDPNYATGAFDVRLEVSLKPKDEEKSSIISVSNLKYMYWNMRQQLVHHSVSGCPMRAGDLLGTGTISGTDKTMFGSMLELSWRGAHEIDLVNSDHAAKRKFLQDGDEVNMTGFTVGAGHRVGFGDVAGKILPAGSYDNLLPPIPVQTAALASTRSTRFRLHSYWRSTSSWRVRLALATKGIAYEYVPVDLSALAGNNTQRLPAEFVESNPLAQVPVLEIITTNSEGVESTVTLTQSLAIIEYLDETYPGATPLMPADTLQRARCRQLAEIVNSGIQPLQNLSLLRQVKQVEVTPATPEETPAVVDGRGYAIIALSKGVASLEKAVVANCPAGSDLFAAGTTFPTVADMCIVPQLYNCRRFGVDMALCPTLVALEARCNAYPAFAAAAPDAQPDAQK